LTPEALSAPWLNFETGAISKGIGQNRLAPILLELAKPDVSGPLALFQLADFNREEIFQVIQSLNKSFEEQRLTEEILKRAFDRWWPDLERDVSAILKSTPSKKAPEKSQRELSDEILLNTREILKEIGRSRLSTNTRAIAEMALINRTASRLYRAIEAEENEKAIMQIRQLGTRLTNFNATRGEKGRPKPWRVTRMGLAKGY
jgi:hypothetical protein